MAMSDKSLFSGEGGSYHSWVDEEKLIDAKLGAGKLVLKPNGFALPHYADSNKIGYVLQGNGGVAGLKFPDTREEKVVSLEKGDTIPVPSGVVSWWYNKSNEEEDLVIVFLGETSKAHVPGQFTYFFLTGLQGILSSFSNDFIQKAYQLNEADAITLAKTQPGALIVTLNNQLVLPRPSRGSSKKFTFNIDEESADVKGGAITSLTENKFHFLGQVGLSAVLEKLAANAMSEPFYLTDSSVQLVYVVRGGGRVQVVGLGGQLALDEKVTAGNLFMVPRYFVVAKIADEEGMDCFSVITTPKPVLEHLAGKTSIWGGISPTVLQASLNVTPEFVKLFISKN